MRRLWLWGVVLVLSLAGAVVAARLPEATRVRFLSSWFPFAMVAAFFLLLVLIFARARTANRYSVEGNSLLAQGRFVEAIEMFERAAKVARRSNVIPYSQGIALLCLWRVEEAEKSFALAAAQRFQAADLTKLLHPARALCAALLDRRSDALQRLEDASRAGAANTAEVVLASAVLAAREGRWADARSLLQRYEVKLLGGPVRGLADGLYAWCVYELTGELRPVDRVGLQGEAGPDALARFWPELVAFIERAPSP